MTDETEDTPVEEPKKKAPRVKLQTAAGKPIKTAKAVRSSADAEQSRTKVTLNRSYAKLDDKTMNTMYPYKQKRQIGPIVIWSLVALLLISGIVLLIAYMMGGDGPSFNLFATRTPTPTITPTPTNTPEPTLTPTETATPTQTFTPTPSAPFEYIVQENDTLYSIAEKFNLGPEGLMMLFELNPETASGYITLGQKILIPNPGYQLATATPIPTGLYYGTKVEYTVRPGDTLQGIASLFNSTMEDIMAENDITDANSLQVGQVLVVRVNLVTATPKPNPTITAGPSPTAPSPFTATPTKAP